MFITDGKNIRIPRGDSASISFTFTEPDGETPYILGEGQLAVLSVFPVKGAEPVITKTADSSGQDSDGSVVFRFSPKETNIPVNTYGYTIKLTDTEDSKKDTWLGFPEDACFAVGTDLPACGVQSANGGINVTVSQIKSRFPAYEGTYTVTPDFTADITLATAERSLSDNITVCRVPVSETPNESGGITLTIGG